VLLPVGILAVVVYKTRTQGETIRDQAEKNARDIRHQGALAAEYAAKTHVAQVEVDVKRPGLAACDIKRAPRQPTGSPRGRGRAGQWLSADRHQLVDRVLGKVDSWESEP
jgi:hypothetical protein